MGQLADGRIILVAVDGDQPGYSAGMTSFELAQTHAASRCGQCVGARAGQRRCDGVRRHAPQPPERHGARAPRTRGAARAVLRRLCAAVAASAAERDPSRQVEPLSYKLVRPSKVTAELIGPDGVPRVLEADVPHDPGVYPGTFAAYDAEGTWHWHVQATDDLGRVSAGRSLVPLRRDDSRAGGPEGRGEKLDDPVHADASRQSAAADRDAKRRRHARFPTRVSHERLAAAHLGRQPPAGDSRLRRLVRRAPLRRRAPSVHLSSACRSDSGVRVPR